MLLRPTEPSPPASRRRSSRRADAETAVACFEALEKRARSMRAAVNSPPPHCYSRRRASATLLDARHVFDHVPQQRLPNLAAGLRARPVAAAAWRPARRSAASAAARTCGTVSGTEMGSFLGLAHSSDRLAALAACHLPLKPPHLFTGVSFGIWPVEAHWIVCFVRWPFMLGEMLGVEDSSIWHKRTVDFHKWEQASV